MEDEIEEILEEMESAGESAALALAEHLRTVASNGEDYATAEALCAEAENIAAWAAEFLARIAELPRAPQTARRAEGN